MSAVKKSSRVSAVKKSSRPASSLRCERHEVGIAVLTQTTNQIADQYETLGAKLDKIGDSVEKLARDTGTLLTRHDERINMLQIQFTAAELELDKTRVDIGAMGARITDQIGAELGKVSRENAIAIASIQEQLKTTDVHMQTQFDAFNFRLSSLERWKIGFVATITGAGAVIIYFLTKLVPLITSLYATHGSTLSR